MKRGVFDILRRAFDNSAANWQLSLIRFLEVFVFGAIFVVAVLAIVIPAVGLSIADFKTPDDFNNVLDLLLDKWLIALWVFLGVSLLALILLALHSFLEAGCARVMVDADRAAGPALEGPRQRYRAFSFERWVAGGSAGWWTIFWIYNIAFGLGGLLMLIPLLPVAGLAWAMRESQGAAVAIGCLGTLFVFFVAFVIMIVVAVWSERAVVEWAARNRGIRESLSFGWRAVRADLARHGGLTLVIVVLMFAGSMFFSSFSYFGAFGGSYDSNPFTLMLMPLQIISSFFSTAFSAFMTSWYLASFAALAVEGEG